MQHSDGSLGIAPRHGRSLDSYHVYQGSTNDCGPHVTAMAVNFWHGASLLEAHEVAREMNRPHLGLGLPPLVVRRIPNWATFPWGIADVLRAHGLRARWRWRASEEDLRRGLAEDHLLMPIFGEPLRRQGVKWQGWSHVALLAGWDPAAQHYIFVDSAQIASPTLKPRDEFWREWSRMGRLVVEAQ